MKIIEQIKALFTGNRDAEFELSARVMAELIAEFEALQRNLEMEASRNKLCFARMNTYRSMFEESEKANAKLLAGLREESSKYELLKGRFQELAKSFERVSYEKEDLAERVQAMSLAHFKSFNQPKPKPAVAVIGSMYDSTTGITKYYFDPIDNHPLEVGQVLYAEKTSN